MSSSDVRWTRRPSHAGIVPSTRARSARLAIARATAMAVGSSGNTRSSMVLDGSLPHVKRRSSRCSREVLLGSGGRTATSTWAMANRGAMCSSRSGVVQGAPVRQRTRLTWGPATRSNASHQAATRNAWTTWSRSSHTTRNGSAPSLASTRPRPASVSEQIRGRYPGPAHKRWPRLSQPCAAIDCNRCRRPRGESPLRKRRWICEVDGTPSTPSAMRISNSSTAGWRGSAAAGGLSHRSARGSA